MNELEKDKVDARRALRTASWGMMFYLVSYPERSWAEEEDYHGCDWTF